MPLVISIGYASVAGTRERNEDFCGVVTLRGAELETKGALLALADGVSGNRGGREAAEPIRYRPDIPKWLEAVLLKAVARDPKLRFETAEEFLLALERGEYRPINAPPPTPLAARDPVLLWRSIALVSLVVNLFLLYYLLAR